MSFLEREIAKNLIEAIKGKEKPKPYDTTAEVVRIEDDIAWVHIPGGVIETPAELSISAKEGDKVKVRVAGGNAWITGNSTSPPTDDKKANLIIKEKIPKIYKQIKFVQKLLDKYGAWINIGVDSENRPVLELGKETSQNKLRLTNEDIQFLLNDLPIGLIDGNRQKINFVNINEQLILSKHWFFEQNKEGNLNIIWRK